MCGLKFGGKIDESREKLNKSRESLQNGIKKTEEAFNAILL